jgi:S-adenosylmethionine-diacylglycerol 3-amino-3-carboxypropyl transferase
MAFFNTLNYSSCNEDGLTELRALNITANDDVCCITGSGDRPLHLLLGDPARVVSFDVNPRQNHLLELKIAAIKELDYQSYVQFLGLYPSVKSRWECYRRLRPCLSEEAARWWDTQCRMIEGGVLYGGRWERYFRFTSRTLRLWRGEKIRRLFNFDALDAQRAFLHRQWDTWMWRLSLRLTLGHFALRFLFGDPGFYRHSASSLPPWRYMHQRLNAFLENHPARSSFMLALVFNGTFFDPLHYPPYLCESNFSVLKNRVCRITIRTASLSEMLDSPENLSCSKYSLSDVSSFLNDEEYKALLEFFDRKKGVRFCMRDFLTYRGVPAPCATPNLRFLTELQESLARDDTSLGYTFIIGENT